MTNCNFHQRHLKKAGDGTYFYELEYFLSKEEVDVVGKRIGKVHRRPPCPYRLKVPDAALDQCDDSHMVASANKAVQVPWFATMISHYSLSTSTLWVSSRSTWSLSSIIFSQCYLPVHRQSFSMTSPAYLTTAYTW